MAAPHTTGSHTKISPSGAEQGSIKLTTPQSLLFRLSDTETGHAAHCSVCAGVADAFLQFVKTHARVVPSISSTYPNTGSTLSVVRPNPAPVTSRLR